MGCVYSAYTLFISVNPLSSKKNVTVTMFWLRIRSSVPGFSAEVPKGGVEFINFLNGSFRSEICSEQLLVTAARIRGQIRKTQCRSMCRRSTS